MAVTYDAATSGQATATTVSISHTATGSDLAAFAGASSQGETPQAPTGVTYNGVSMTSLFTPLASGGARCGAYYLAGIPTGAQTVIASFAGTADRSALAVISMTGVDQTTPVGTPATSTTTTNTPSVTVGSVGSEDLLCDIVHGAGFSPISTAGANQTERTQEAFLSSVHAATSTQSGADGGVMSWTVDSDFGSLLGAVAFKPVAAGGAANPKGPLSGIMLCGPLQRVVGF